MQNTLASFLDEWHTDTLGMKPVFAALHAFLADQPDALLEFKGRPGISYSLRAKRNAQSERPLFVLVDVIDDEPENRWLSVCFYADLVTDPQQRGDVVPAGLMGEDACCFDVETQEMGGYILERVQEAYAKAER